MAYPHQQAEQQKTKSQMLPFLETVKAASEDDTSGSPTQGPENNHSVKCGKCSGEELVGLKGLEKSC